jgi:hypothetical protein
VATTDERDTEDEHRGNGSGAGEGARVNGAGRSTVATHLLAGKHAGGDGSLEHPRLTGAFAEKAAADKTFKGALGDWGGNWLRRMILLWAGARHKWRPNVWAASIGTVALGLIVLGGILAYFGVRLPHPALSCSKHEFGCGVAGGTLVTIFIAAAAFIWLILVRVFVVVNWGYARDARRNANDFVATAADIDEVVGRDDLCRVVEEELRVPATRRPQVIVGGVGAGKTAVLVRLAERLAERGAVPVAVRLRDLKEDEGIRDLAARKFRSVNEHRFKSDGEADRIWRRMCAIGVIVILADGLEEAMSGTDARETSVRQALDDAHRLKFPLVVTSRPDEALVTLDAALIELGPLDEEQALAYVVKSRPPPDDSEVEDQTLRALMSAAKVAEMPLYLQLTRDLYRRDLFRPADLSHLDDEHRLDIRLRLLENWLGRVEEGRLQPDASITTEQRRDTIADLSIVAASALVRDTLEVKFKSLTADEESRSDAVSLPALVAIDPAKARMAANLGARLGIVETLRAGVRFRHSIMQAYLGSLWIRDHELEHSDYVAKGLEEGGREFLMALTMASARFTPTPGGTPHATVLGKIIEELRKAATQPRCPDDRRVLLIATAYEIDRMIDRAPASTLGEWCRTTWPPRTVGPRVVEAKGLAVDRIAEVRGHDAYQTLYDLCLVEPNYRVRVAAAQYLGSGGDVASAALREKLKRVVAQARRAKEAGFVHATVAQSREYALQGWILPLMAATADDERDDVLKLLDEWLEVCSGAPAALDACLAQGLKYEANRVLGRREDRTARTHLVAQAEALLEKTEYWYTRMTLLHAMTLWMLSESPRPSDDQRRRLARWSGEHVHPFVSAAADLCASALQTRNPSPYIWIDETGIVAKLGQQTAIADTSVDTSLWLPNSLGWVALKPRAVRLVADTLLMLNLTDGEQPLGNALEPGNGTANQFQRIRQASRPTLPPCLMRSGERACLSVLRDEDDRSWVMPGVKCAGSCEFLLCPYPASGGTLRPEFSEAFCRHVANVKGRSGWQQMEKQELRAFWRRMERRARAG